MKYIIFILLSLAFNTLSAPVYPTLPQLISQQQSPTLDTRISLGTRPTGFNYNHAPRPQTSNFIYVDGLGRPINGNSNKNTNGLP